jgi:hypothetical protein
MYLLLYHICQDNNILLKYDLYIVTRKLAQKAMGSISSNFFCRAKSCQRTVFGEKFAIQFHQHSAAKFDKYTA